MAGTGPLDTASTMLAAARRVQSGRIRTISENIANAKSTAATPGGDPYARKIAVFGPVVPDTDRDPVGAIARDQGGYQNRYEPGSPAADPQGLVKMPNVNLSIESTNLQTVIRSYELNLSAASSINSISKATLDLLK